VRKKVWILFFVLSLSVLVLAYFYKDPSVKFRNLNRFQLFDHIVASFKDSEKPESKFNFSQLPQFSIDRSLVDPAYTLPHYFNFSSEITKFVETEASCESIETIRFTELPEKFSVWLKFKCQRIKELPDDFITTFPFMHPSGVSFAKLVNSKKTDFTHILETGMGSPDLFWALFKGVNIIVESDKVWFREETNTERDSADASYSIYSKGVFDKYLNNLGLEVVSSDEVVTETFPAFYFAISKNKQNLNSLRRYLMATSLATLFGLLVVWLIQLLRLRLSEQSRRTFSFQLLAHELRTPVATLKLEVDELLRRYDDLPAWAQGKALRFADNLDRLGNVVKASEHYIRTQKNSSYLDTTTNNIESLRELIEKLRENYDEKSLHVSDSEDILLDMDPYWASFCISNLISNGLQHGISPVVVSWKQQSGSVEITVADRGEELKLDPRSILKKNRTDGLGIGLAMVDRVARELGGSLEFKSNPTTWILSFKRAVK
jgi:signal transduction histidine kinase